MKLGLCIQEVYNGEKRVFESEKNASWLRGVIDLRQAISKTFLRKEKSFRIITFSEEGAFVVSGITLSGGRNSDYMAAWLYIPRDIFLTTKNNLAKLSTRLLSLLDEYDENNLTPFKQFIGSLPDEKKEYIFDFKIEPKSSEASYAILYYDDSLVERLLTPVFMYQPTYKKYKAIVLLEKKEKSNECKLDDLSNNSLQQLTIVKIGGGANTNYTIFLEDKEQDQLLSSHHPIFTYVGSDLRLRFERSGFLPIRKNYKVKGNDVITPTNLEWELLISKKMFIVTNQDGEVIDNFQFIIKGFPTTPDLSYKVSEQNAQRLQVTFSAPGYEIFTPTLNVFGHNIIHIELKYKKEDHVYITPLRNSSFISIKMNERVGLFESPLQGYKLSEKLEKDNSRRLIYSPRLMDKKVLFYVIGSALLGLLLGGLISWATMNWYPKPQPSEKTTIMSDSTVNDTIVQIIPLDSVPDKKQ